MREFSVPATSTVADDENLTDMVWANAERFGHAVGFRRLVDGSWVDVTTRDFAAHVLAVAKGLVAAGLQPGDRVGLMSKTRYEWSLLDFAIWAAGCVTVPIYETSTADQLVWIMSDSRARAMIVETDAHRQVVESVVDRLAEVVRVWQIEDTGRDRGGIAPAIDELTSLGAEVDDDTAHKLRRNVHADDTATVVYTSGTSGAPKGVELTHRSLLAQVRADLAAFPELLRPGHSMLMFLPMAHVFARTISICCVYARTTLGHLPDVQNLVGDLGTFRPTFMVAVPKVFEKLYRTAKQKAYGEGRGMIFETAERIAVDHSMARETTGPNLALRLTHTAASKLVYGQFKGTLGGRCVAAISGSTVLDERLAHFFRGIGIPVYEGYGLTETCAAATVNTRTSVRVGTVGRPLPGVSVRIADDGEVLIGGDILFRGYWNDPDATAAALRDGWLHTGDLGHLDDAGYLTITGRKHEVIVTAGGKRVAPAALEDRLRAHPLIGDCMAVGDRKPFIGALITIDEDHFRLWKARHGKPHTAGVADLVNDADLLAAVQAAVDEVNRTVSRAESIRGFRVLPTAFSQANGELTPNLKLRRDVVGKTRAAEIVAIYGD